MKQLSRYDLIAVAYRSRFLYRTDAEFRDVLGVSFETVIKNRDSEHNISVYYNLLNAECLSRVDKTLDEVIGDYVLASELYLQTDWGERTQMASRKRFCRMLFRLYATAGMELSVDEIFKFKVKDDDKRLLDLFFPDGTDKTPAVEIPYIMLFAFGVIRPWNGADGSRSRDIQDKDTEVALVRLRSLIETVCEDMPRLGSTQKPMAFYEWIETIDTYLHNRELWPEVMPLRLFYALLSVSYACRTLVDTEQRRIASDRLQGYDMRGIWVDDADRGENRFWIFPDNFLMAFCFCRQGNGWEMIPYELLVRFSDDPSFSDSFILLEPEGNLAHTISPESVISTEQLASGLCECKFDPATGEICRVELREEPCKFPDWLNWRRWERLNSDDMLYKEFRTVVGEVYNPDSPHSLFFRNVAPELTDVVNNLVGRDRKYLYVYDWRPGKFVIREKRRDIFTYESMTCEGHTDKALFELDVSEEHPVYALPRHRHREKYRNPDAALLADLLEDAENISELYIIHSELSSHPRLVFPSHGRSVKLDMNALEELGVRKFTGRFGL